MLFHFFKRLFLDAADVGTRNVERGGDLTLGKRRGSSKTVAKNDDLLFPFVKDLVDQAVNALGVDLQIKISRDVVIGADHVYVGERVSVSVYVNGLMDRNLTG